MEAAKLAFGYILLIASAEFASTYIRKAAKLLEEHWHKSSAILWALSHTPATMAFCLVAALKNTPGLVVGSIIGAHIMLIAVVFPIVYILAKVPVFKVKILASPFILLGATVLATIFLLNRTVSFGEGLCLLALIPFYYVLFFRKMTFEQRIYKDLSFVAMNFTSRHTSVNLLIAIVFLVFTVLGAFLFHAQLIPIIKIHHFSPLDSGLHVVAIFLTLPPIIRSLIIYRRNQSLNPALLVTGMTNTLIMNLLVILGLSAVLFDMTAPDLDVNVDLSMFLGYTVLFAILLLTERLKSAKLPFLMITGFLLYSLYKIIS